MKLNMFSPFKVLAHTKTLKDIASGKQVYPISCEIDPSNFCNHSCVWCINGKFRRKEKVFLNTDVALKAINQLAEVGVKSITFTGGGEPLSHPDIVLLLNYVREKGMEVALVTNGGLFNKEKADAVVRTCSFVRLSLDAGEEKTYKKLHRPVRNTLQDVLSWINYINLNASNNFIIGTAFLVHPFNYLELTTAAKLVKEAGASYIQVRPVYMRGMELTERVLSETHRQLQELKYIESDNFKVYPILHRFDELNQMDKPFDECLGHNLLGVIAANGKMYVCCQLRGMDRYCLGDLNRNTFKEIWNGEQRQEVLRHINVHKCPPCRYTKYNEIIGSLKNGKTHANFL